LREILRQRGMRAIFAVPAVIAHIHCDLVRSLAAEGHEIAAHGFRHEDVSGLERDEERRRITRATEILADVAGRKPAGWFSLPRQGDRYAVGTVSPNTIDLLLEAGYVYLGNGLADDIPHYWVSNFASRRALLTRPYYYHFDDQFFLMFPRKGTGLEHPDALLHNGFIAYVHSLPRGPMFPQYRTNKYNRRNDYASKVNSEFVRKLGIKDRRKAPMHSWRHFAKTYFKNDPLVKEEIHDAITGHGSDSEGRRYGVYELRAMAEAIARLPNPLQQGRPPATG